MRSQDIRGFRRASARTGSVLRARETTLALDEFDDGIMVLSLLKNASFEITFVKCTQMYNM